MYVCDCRCRFGAAHFPVHFDPGNPKNRKQCVVHKSRKEVVWACYQCKKVMCIGCFGRYHLMKKFKLSRGGNQNVLEIAAGAEEDAHSSDAEMLSD